MEGATPEKYRRMLSALSTPLSTVKGVGPKFAEKFAARGIRNLGQALSFLPLRHEDRTKLTPLADLLPDGQAAFVGEIVSIDTVGHHRRRYAEAVLADDSGALSLKWFRGNLDWIVKKYPVGTRLFGHGAVKEYRGRLEVVHPELETLYDEGGDEVEGVAPVYSEIEGVHPRMVRRIMREAVETAAEYVVNLVPEEALAAGGQNPAEWSDLGAVWRELHSPGEGGPELSAKLEACRRIVVLEEFFFLQLGLLMKKQGEGRTGIAFTPDFRLIKPFLASLPFQLTDAQRRVLSAIRRDMETPRPMHRLLQGDVGSGKTLVALLAALMCVESGYQAALMVPTEVLAEQHYATLTRFLKGHPVGVGLLTGSAKAETRAKVADSLISGGLDILVGTHALIQEEVAFGRLGLVIIDEQHRFGVLQRATLASKGREPDLLVMTATPIPRSLSMTVYGDLDLSVIDELPPGRHPVTTRLVRGDRTRVYEFVRSEVKAGRQAFVVCPLVEESEKLELAAAVETAERFRCEVFPDLAVGLLHGRMKAEEKEAAIVAFAEGETQVLVATTVIEVGIDIPNASVMVIEHAERYGLSQLHQLRGRVGRGPHKSWCILLGGERLGEDAWQRLKIMTETEDGFRISEEDLKIRGPGDMLGTRQAGLPDFSVANLLRDGAQLEVARAMAHAVIDRDPSLAKPEHAVLRRALFDRWAEKLSLVNAG